MNRYWGKCVDNRSSALHPLTKDKLYLCENCNGITSVKVIDDNGKECVRDRSRFKRVKVTEVCDE